MNIGIIGLGLIGGSAGLAIKQKGIAKKVLGFDANESHSLKAVQLGLIDESRTLEGLVSDSDLILIAIPVDATISILPQLLNLVDQHTTIVDMGSTKGSICEVIAQHPKRGRFVAAHPIAGTEYSGPEAAIADLYIGKKAILCNLDESDSDAVALVRLVFDKMGLQLIEMEAHDHDLHLAYVSHLSHISSFTLGLAVIDKERDEKNIFDLAGSGFASTVRLAKSSPAMWGPIFEQNRDHILDAMDGYIAYLKIFRKCIREGNQEQLNQLMQRANRIREVLDQKEKVAAAININSN